MRQHLHHLYEVQKIDLSIRELEKESQSLPSKLQQLETDVGALRGDIAKLNEQRDAIVREVKNLDGTLQAETHKLRKWEARLHEIRNQREYLALSREIEGGKRQNRETEERMQAQSKEREALTVKLAEYEERLSAADAACAAERQTVQEAIDGLKARLDSEKARRDAFMPLISPHLIKKYDAIRSKRFGLGLVLVVEGSCTGCNMKLPPQLYNILQRGDTIEQCPSCSRLVLWERFLQNEEAPAESAETSSNRKAAAR